MALTPEEKVLISGAIDRVKTALAGSLSDAEVAKVLDEIARPVNGTSGFFSEPEKKAARLQKEVFDNREFLRSLGMHI